MKKYHPIYRFWNSSSKYNFSDAAKRCSSKKNSALNKLNNFILLDRLLMRINLLKLFIADNMNLYDGGSQINIVLKAKFRAFQTISIEHNKIHHVQTPSCFQNFIFNLTSESLLWCLIIVLFFLKLMW